MAKYDTEEWTYPGAERESPTPNSDIIPQHYADSATELQRLIKGKKGKKKPKQKWTVMPDNPAPGTLEAMAQYLRTPAKKRDETVLDNLIWKNGLANHPIEDTAAITGLPVLEVRQRWLEMLNDRGNYSQVEMRLQLTAQTNALINMMWEAAAHGSTEHAKVLLLAIDRLSKLHDLESKKVEIEIELVTNGQAELFSRLMTVMLSGVLQHPAIAGVLSPEIVESVSYQVLSEVQPMLDEAERTLLVANPTVVEKKMEITQRTTEV